MRGDRNDIRWMTLYSVAFLIRTLICEWYVVWCRSTDGYQNHVCLEEVGMHGRQQT